MRVKLTVQHNFSRFTMRNQRQKQESSSSHQVISTNFTVGKQINYAFPFLILLGIKILTLWTVCGYAMLRSMFDS